MKLLTYLVGLMTVMVYVFLLLADPLVLIAHGFREHILMLAFVSLSSCTEVHREQLQVSAANSKLLV
jgi:hypothetical protein